MTPIKLLMCVKSIRKFYDDVCYDVIFSNMYCHIVYAIQLSNKNVCYKWSKQTEARAQPDSPETRVVAVRMKTRRSHQTDPMDQVSEALAFRHGPRGSQPNQAWFCPQVLSYLVSLLMLSSIWWETHLPSQLIMVKLLSFAFAEVLHTVQVANAIMVDAPHECLETSHRPHSWAANYAVLS